MTEILDAPTRPSGRNYVGGAWVPAVSGDTYTKANPMRPGEIVGEFSSSSEADADAAVAAAAAAFAEWAALPLARRAGYLTTAAFSATPASGITAMAPAPATPRSTSCRCSILPGAAWPRWGPASRACA